MNLFILIFRDTNVQNTEVELRKYDYLSLPGHGSTEIPLNLKENTLDIFIFILHVYLLHYDIKWQ